MSPPEEVVPATSVGQAGLCALRSEDTPLRHIRPGGAQATKERRASTHATLPTPFGAQPTLRQPSGASRTTCRRTSAARDFLTCTSPARARSHGMCAPCAWEWARIEARPICCSLLHVRVVLSPISVVGRATVRAPGGRFIVCVTVLLITIFLCMHPSLSRAQEGRATEECASVARWPRVAYRVSQSARRDAPQITPHILVCHV